MSLHSSREPRRRLPACLAIVCHRRPRSALRLVDAARRWKIAGVLLRLCQELIEQIVQGFRARAVGRPHLGDELVEATLEVLELLDAHHREVAIARVEEIAVDLISLDPGPERFEIARRPKVVAIAEERIEIVGYELGGVSEKRVGVWCDRG